MKKSVLRNRSSARARTIGRDTVESGVRTYVRTCVRACVRECVYVRVRDFGPNCPSLSATRSTCVPRDRPCTTDLRDGGENARRVFEGISAHAWIAHATGPANPSISLSLSLSVSLSYLAPRIRLATRFARAVSRVIIVHLRRVRWRRRRYAVYSTGVRFY